MESLFVECQQQLVEQWQRMLVNQQSAFRRLASAHAEEMDRLRAENAELRSRLETAQRRAASCCTPPVDQDELMVDEGESLDVACSFPGWEHVLSSDVVRVRAVADDGALTLCVHRALLQRSPYFRARLANRWTEAPPQNEQETDALALRLPAGCPAAAARLLLQHLYTDDAACFGISGLDIKDASMALSVAQIASMLLLDDVASNLSQLACKLLGSPEEASELERRFVVLPSAVSAACRCAQDVPAVQMQAGDLARMLQGTAQSRETRPLAEALLAAHGRTAACSKAIVAALRAAPFRVDAPKVGSPFAFIDRDAFAWLWGLAREYLLVPGSEASLSAFFGGIAGYRLANESDPPQALPIFAEETAAPLREAFGAYLRHLAVTQQGSELCKAFRLGVETEAHVVRGGRHRLTYRNVLSFGPWSKELLPKLLQDAGTARADLQAEFLKLHADVLAALLDDVLLEAFGADIGAVCGRIAEDPDVLLRWVTKRRLRVVPLSVRRRLCARLVPFLGALRSDIASVVLQVMQGCGTQAPGDTHGCNVKLGLAPQTSIVVVVALSVALLVSLVGWLMTPLVEEAFA